jgi:hypothetical protein
MSSQYSKKEIDELLSQYIHHNDEMEQMVLEILDKIDSTKLQALKATITAKNYYYIINADEADSVDSLVYMLASFTLSRMTESNFRKLQLKYETEQNL